MLKIKVVVRDKDDRIVHAYVMDHDAPAERRRLGEECRRAFKAGQSVHTTPIPRDTTNQ